jgi:hypothetical protein
VSPSKQLSTRTQKCTKEQAASRLRHAKRFLEVAELVQEEDDPESEYGTISASLAVLAGIAASDAACCYRLGQRSRSQNHHDAEQLLSNIPYFGDQASKALRRLLNLKDTAHYGFISVSNSELKAAIRQARQLVELAEQAIRNT